MFGASIFNTYSFLVMMEISFVFKGMLLLFLGAMAKALHFSWEALIFMAILYLLVRFNPAIVSPLKFIRQGFASLKRKRSRKAYGRLCDEIKEFKYLRAQKIFDETMKLIASNSAIKKNDPLVHYNLARAYSLYNKPKEALFHLRQAIESGYADVARAQKDVDLAGLRLYPEFQKWCGVGASNRTNG